jgi:chromosomal replication initiator protein
MKEIIEIVSKFYGVSQEDIFNKNRNSPIPKARQVCQYLVKNKFNYTLEETGKLFNRNHSTIIYSIKTIENELQVNKIMRQEIELLKSMITERNKKDGKMFCNQCKY